ncbi:MAG: hypothetical protein M3229_00525 [Actinomycetota bacterium]|nr:hypothetical protein [Actinomycetota bacterium]
MWVSMGSEAVAATDVLALVTLSMVLALLGQLVRFLAELADPENVPFDLVHFLVSLATAVAVGAVAGGVGAVTFIGRELDTKDVVGLIAIGYVGTDILEQFLKRAFQGLTGDGRFDWPVADHERDGSSVWESSKR